MRTLAYISECLTNLALVLDLCLKSDASFLFPWGMTSEGEDSDSHSHSRSLIHFFFSIVDDLVFKFPASFSFTTSTLPPS